MSELLSLDRDERGIYTLTFRRPEVRNALNDQSFTQLIGACAEVAADPWVVESLCKRRRSAARSAAL